MNEQTKQKKKKEEEEEERKKGSKFPSLNSPQAGARLLSENSLFSSGLER